LARAAAAGNAGAFISFSAAATYSMGLPTTLPMVVFDQTNPLSYLL